MSQSRNLRRAITLSTLLLGASAGVMFAGDASTADVNGQLGAHRYTLSVNGGPAGSLKSFAGGFAEAEVVSNVLGPTKLPSKHIASPKVGNASVQAYMDDSTELPALIDSTLSFSDAPKNLALVACNTQESELFDQSLTNARVREVTFPGLDVQGSGYAIMTVGLAAERSVTAWHSTANCPKVQAVPTTERATNSSFRVELDGIDTSGVVVVEPFTVKATLAEQDPSQLSSRSSGQTLASVEIPNLVFTITSSKADGFVSWFQDSVINGNATEKNGAIVLLNQDRSKELSRISLSGVGIFALSIGNDDAGISRFKAKLYVEGMRYSVGGAPPVAVKRQLNKVANLKSESLGGGKAITAPAKPKPKPKK